MMFLGALGIGTAPVGGGGVQIVPNVSQQSCYDMGGTPTNARCIQPGTNGCVKYAYDCAIPLAPTPAPAPAPAPVITVSPVVTTQVSPQISPVFQQQFQPTNSPMDATTTQTTPSPPVPVPGLTQADLDAALAKQQAAYSAAEKQRADSLALALEKQKLDAAAAQEAMLKAIRDAGVTSSSTPPSPAPPPPASVPVYYDNTSAPVAPVTPPPQMPIDTPKPEAAGVNWPIIAAIGAGLLLLAR